MTSLQFSTSRHDIEWEIKELENFESDVILYQAASCIKSVFYDSNANLCCFEFQEGFDEYSPEGFTIKSLALKYLSQFMWGDVVLHGNPKSDYHQQFKKFA